MIATTIEKDTLSEIGAPKVITSDAQNERYIAALLQLEKKSHPTAAERDFAKLLTVLIEAYEEEHYSVRDASPIEVLAELMQANNLIQKDLVSIFGTESMASMVLNGKRPLSLEHAVALGRRFHIAPAAFIPKK
jgi:HTH-type transcriptional regulator / antitoxin HigA